MDLRVARSNPLGRERLHPVDLHWAVSMLEAQLRQISCHLIFKVISSDERVQLIKCLQVTEVAAFTAARAANDEFSQICILVALGMVVQMHGEISVSCPTHIAGETTLRHDFERGGRRRARLNGGSSS